MKKVCMILAPTNFRDLEFLVPKAFFEANNIEVITTSTTNISQGRFWYIQKHTKTIYELRNKLFDAIVFVWWVGSLVLWEDEKVKTFTQNHFQNNKIIASICAAPRNLLKWNLVSGKKLTGHNWDNNFADLAREAWAEAENKGLVIDGNLITAYGPENAEEFALAVIKELS